MEKKPKYRVNGIANVLSRDRFFQIKRFLSFSDPNRIVDESDKLDKIRPVVDTILTNSQKYWTPSEFVCIDESMIEFRGRHFGKVYMPSKPIRYEFKMYVYADTVGYVLNCIPSFSFAKGKHTMKDVVNELIKGYEGQNFHLFMDK